MSEDELKKLVEEVEKEMEGGKPKKGKDEGKPEGKDEGKDGEGKKGPAKKEDGEKLVKEEGEEKLAEGGGEEKAEGGEAVYFVVKKVKGKKGGDGYFKEKSKGGKKGDLPKVEKEEGPDVD